MQCSRQRPSTGSTTTRSCSIAFDLSFTPVAGSWRSAAESATASSCKSAIDDVAGRPPFAAHLAGWPGPWNFPTPRQTAERLRDAGFTDVSAWLIQRPAPYEELGEWLRANALSAHLERLPEDLREDFLAAIEEQLGEEPEITYVRLNMDATAAPIASIA